LTPVPRAWRRRREYAIPPCRISRLRSHWLGLSNASLYEPGSLQSESISVLASRRASRA
jgi:hypothetical protein